MNTVTLYQRDNMRQIQEIKLQQSKTEKLKKLVNCRIIPKVSPYTLSKCTQISPELWHFSPQVQKRYDYVTKRTRKSIKISFCFQTGDKTVIYGSTHWHWDCTTLQHHCTTFGFASGYTEVLQGSTISMPTGRHVDNLYYPRLDKNVGFWLVDDPLVQNPCYRLVVT
jgi:hypothetical protein